MLRLNGVQVIPTFFPDKTSQVWKLPKDLVNPLHSQLITWDFENEAEFLHLAQLKTLLDSKIRIRPIFLVINYLPYGRQDKYASNEATFALHTFASLLNSLCFSDVKIIDPHSDVALRLIRYSRAAYPEDEVRAAIQRVEAELICYPDKGAFTKYRETYTLDVPHIYGEKVRDQLTGNITSYELKGDPRNQNVLIVDDICDGGMTFKILAKDLLAAGAKSVHLFVTHGIFSKGLETLHESGITTIFTRDGEKSKI